MKSFLCLSVILVLSGWSTTEALQCHLCGYIDGVPEEYLSFLPAELTELLDESCKHGNTPNDTFAVTCEEDDPNATFACAMLSLSQTIPMEGQDDLVVDATVRSCIPVPENLANTCEAFRKKELEALLPDEDLSQFPDFCGSICTCATNLCAAADAGNQCGSGSESIIAKSSVTMWMLPIALLISKIIL